MKLSPDQIDTIITAVISALTWWLGQRRGQRKERQRQSSTKDTNNNA